MSSIFWEIYQAQEKYLSDKQQYTNLDVLAHSLESTAEHDLIVFEFGGPVSLTI